MVTIGGPHEGRVIVPQVFAGQEAGPVSENNIILSEALLGSGRRGDEENSAGPETEEEYGAVTAGEFGEGAVEWVLEEVEVP